MYKILILLLSSFSFLFASNSYFNQSKELIKLNKKFTDKVIEAKYKSFLSDSGFTKKELFDKVDRSDENWLLGMEYYFYQSDNSKINYESGYGSYKQKSLPVKLPLYKKSLEQFYLSAIKGNELSAYMGANIIIKKFLYLDSSGKYMNNDVKGIVNTYLPTFLNVLVKNNYCYGYVFSVVYQDSNLIQSNDKLKYKLIVNGLKHCSDKHPFYMKNGLLKKKKHMDAIIKIRGIK